MAFGIDTSFRHAEGEYEYRRQFAGRNVSSARATNTTYVNAYTLRYRIYMVS